MKTSTQLKALIRNLSKAKNVEAEIILRNFMLERFLERVSASEYKNNFILKGGMLIAAMVGIDTRTTMDLDATITGQALTEAQITGIFENILLVPVDDNVLLTFRGVEEIREEADYPGYRVSIDAVMDKTRQTLHIDITTGDFVTPREIEYSFQLMFEERSISILAYNLETVLAEKIETVITRGLTNTRMRDFYDIYILTTTKEINKEIFLKALEKTAQRRKTSDQMVDVGVIIDRIETSGILVDLWHRYQKKYSYAADISWEMVVRALHGIGRDINIS
ncbi:MAG: nucleotidyl transferase AbiEii/AbiGii toxin family protein [Clostridiales Family XIII bacterium]|jgi:predicted nucleotidyltransferase component of viral defense system|nr:nucleotidyl transferase AbiEii/AbiGii toxin family protein [Clostridiales Family XIII bacterium]